MALIICCTAAILTVMTMTSQGTKHRICLSPCKTESFPTLSRVIALNFQEDNESIKRQPVGAFSTSTKAITKTTAQITIIHETNSASSMEKRHLAFLKVHKAASSTLQNIIYRFGYKRRLSFVLPVDTHYISQNKFVYNKVLKPLQIDNSSGAMSGNTEGKYDILCNHVVFNHDLFRGLLREDTVYIAIIREPLQLFLSAAQYYRFVWTADYLSKLNNDTYIKDLIYHPELHESTDLNNSRTYNSMTKDFGFVMNSFEDVAKVTMEMFQDFLDEAAEIFKLVMIVERFDESLIILKRNLHWKFRDILYIKRNVGPMIEIGAVTEEDKAIFRKRQRFDYRLYEHFYNIFESKVKTADRLQEEVAAFKEIRARVEKFCLNIPENVTDILVDSNVWTVEFSVTVDDCDLMLLDELPFNELLKIRHKQMLKETSSNM